MKVELEKRREEIRSLEEEAERNKSKERRQKTQIVREDLEQKQMKATRQVTAASLLAAPGSQQLEQLQTAVGATYDSAQAIEQTQFNERVPYHQSGVTSANTIQMLGESRSIDNAASAEQFQSRDTLH